MQLIEKKNISVTPPSAAVVAKSTHFLKTDAKNYNPVEIGTANSADNIACNSQP